MNNGNASTTSDADATLKKAGDAQERCDGIVQEIKEHYDLLLDLRDREIGELKGKLAKRPPAAVKPRLLVVDNAQSMSAIMNRYLEGQTVEVVCVAGSQALAQLRLGAFDAIMLEASTYVSEKVDGLTLCHGLCNEGLGHIVVVTSSRPGDRIRNSVEQAGARFLRKPFKRKDVVEILRNIRPRNRK